MIKIEAITLEDAYQEAASSFKCSITELNVEVVQYPTGGFLGFFKKKAIIVAALKKPEVVEKQEPSKEDIPSIEPETVVKNETMVKEEQTIEDHQTPVMLHDTIMPASFVSDQTEDDEVELESGLSYTADYDDEYDEQNDISSEMTSIAQEVEEQINKLFATTCFEIEKIEVSAYDDQTLLVEFKGEDAALLIGKEGYRYKALSYMLFNWVNATYQVQLRLEIAEFLQNQEDAISRYLLGIYEIVDRDGRAQTKILDGVLVQIALKELRERYPDKYVAIRTTRDGLKYIIVNDYNNYGSNY